jgi:quinol-cytochrome oxidoreductase complex cytochrome b subunit
MSTPNKSWSVKVRKATIEQFKPEDILPDRQPAYVTSWIYVFGVATLAAFVMLIASGLYLTLEGPSWWHTSSVGHYVNSVHLWSVELFFVFMVVHLWGKFWMAAWRGKRLATWITGGIAFLTSIITGFTGYLIQTNFDSQWIAGQAKDAKHRSSDSLTRLIAASRARRHRGLARHSGAPPWSRTTYR